MDKDSYMRHTCAHLLFLLCLVAGDALAADGTVAPRQWSLVSDRDGIQIYMAHNDDSRIKTFRGVMVMELDDFYSPIAILDDYEYYGRWMYLIEGLSEVRRRSPQDRDVHVRTKLPWPVGDRDAGLQLTVNQDTKTGEIRIQFRSRDGILPARDDYVRIPEMVGHFNTLPLGGRKVQVTFEVLLDPGGYIPAFLANFILKDIPFVSLQRFRRVINTERFANHRVDYIGPPAAWQVDADSRR